MAPIAAKDRELSSYDQAPSQKPCEMTPEGFNTLQAAAANRKIDTQFVAAFNDWFETSYTVQQLMGYLRHTRPHLVTGKDGGPASTRERRRGTDWTIVTKVWLQEASTWKRDIFHRLKAVQQRTERSGCRS